MKRALVLCAVILLASVLSFAAVPDGWFVAGSTPTQYAVGLDSQTHAGSPSVALRSTASNLTGFVTLMQSFLPDGYTGKRVRFSAWVKADRVTGWAGLWMRMDAGNLPAGFDNMQNRAIQGTSDWTQYSIVLDVPAGTTGINFGILLDHAGTVWISGCKFEVVGTDVPVTATYTTPSAPQNLEFKK